MKTRILRIDPHNIDTDLIRQAADVIKNRGLVAFPTETVYGLGADALDEKAVIRIYEAKKRPLDDPLIVHIARKEDLYRLTEDVPKEAERLIEKFWPGPLTVICKKKDIVPDIVSTGLDTVAVRMPSHPIAKKLIEASGTPIAAPSANLFGRPSPTMAKHVLNDLGNEIDMVIDGGSSEIGVESTVVEFSGKEARILRPGGITPDDIREFIKKVNVYTIEEAVKNSPGKYSQHYAPSGKVIIVDEGYNQASKAMDIARKYEREGHKVGIMAKEEHKEICEGANVKFIGPGTDAGVCAANLFRVLREFDSEKMDVIVAEAISEKGIGLAVMNRLRKAAGV